MGVIRSSTGIDRSPDRDDLEHLGDVPFGQPETGRRGGAEAADALLQLGPATGLGDVRPQRVLAPSPEIYWDRLGVSHPDHRAVGEAALAAVYPDARNPFAHPELLADEGLDAWTVAELWLMGAPPERAQHVVDITATFYRKVAALRAHVSQTGRWTELEQRIRGFGAATAARFRLPEGHIAEVFQVVTIG